MRISRLIKWTWFAPLGVRCIAQMSNLAVSYAAIILADSDVEITSDKLLTLVKSANVSGVEPIYAQLYAKAIAQQDTKELLRAFGATAGGDAGTAAGAGASVGGAAAAPAAEEAKKEESEEESDMDMGMLF